MQIKNLQNSEKVPFNLEAFILHSEKPVEIVHLSLNPGEILSEHKNPFNVIFFVIEGSGLLTIDGVTQQLNANDTLKITSDKLRSWTNNTSSPLRLLVIKLI